MKIWVRHIFSDDRNIKIWVRHSSVMMNCTTEIDPSTHKSNLRVGAPHAQILHSSLTIGRSLHPQSKLYKTNTYKSR